jgi:hypothetical protein
MRKPYVYLYTSSAVLLVIGFLLIAMDLVTKAQGVAPNTGILALLDLKASAVQGGLVAMAVGLYHFFLGRQVDLAYHKPDPKVDLLEGNDI